MPVNRSFSLGVAILSFVLLASAATQAFDGNRKGFVAGIGLGVTPIAHWASESPKIDVTELGFGGNALIGYAWDDRNMIVYEGNGSLYKASNLSSSYVIEGLDGVRWYHYWGDQKRRVFTSVGIGYLIFGTEYCNVDGSGFGYTLGIGYEFLKQLQVGAYYIGAHTSNDFDVKAKHSILNVLVTLVAY